MREEFQKQLEDNLFAVVIFVQSSKGTLLVSRRNRPDDFGFPGGKIDPGERPIDAARRELKEETGLDALDLRLIYVSLEMTCGWRKVGVYLAHVDEAQPINAEEGLNVIWGDIYLTTRPESAFADFNQQFVEAYESLWANDGAM